MNEKTGDNEMQGVEGSDKEEEMREKEDGLETESPKETKSAENHIEMHFLSTLSAATKNSALNKKNSTT